MLPQSSIYDNDIAIDIVVIDAASFADFGIDFW
jgi:hypothetical protein